MLTAYAIIWFKRETINIVDVVNVVNSKCSGYHYCKIYLSKPELRFCPGLNPPCGVLEIRDGEGHWQWSQLEIRLNFFRRSTIPENQFINIHYHHGRYVLIMSHTRFRVILHSLVAWMSRNSLLKTDTISEV